MILELAINEAEAQLQWCVRKGRRENRHIEIKRNPRHPEQGTWKWSTEDYLDHWPTHATIRILNGEVVTEYMEANK